MIKRFRKLTRSADLRRRASVLIICVGVLAVLMIFAATLALVGRVEVRASRNWELQTQGDHIAKAVLQYSMYVIEIDKYGNDGVPYNYDLGDMLGNGQDENFDAAGPDGSDNGHEEWLVNHFTTHSVTPWRSARFGNADIWGNPTWHDGAGLLSNIAGSVPAEMKMRYALAIIDAGALASINDCGNKASGTSTHTANEGMSTFEISLAEILDYAGDGTPATTAGNLINSRHGANLLPGLNLVSDTDALVVSNADNDGDGTLGDEPPLTSPAVDEPQEFVTLRPFSDDRPFGAESLHELTVFPVLAVLNSTVYAIPTSNSRAGALIASGVRGAATTGVPLFSPYVAGWSVAGRCAELSGVAPAAPTVTRETPAIPADASSWQSLFHATPPTRVTNSTIKMLSRRTLHSLVTASTGAPATLEAFLRATGPRITVAGALASTNAQRAVTNQTAVNMMDFVDADDTVTTASMTVGVGNYPFYGVEHVPYITEMGVAIRYDGTSNYFLHGYIKVLNPWDSATAANAFDLDAGTWSVLKDTVDADAPDFTWGTITLPAIPARKTLLITNVASTDKAWLSGLFDGTGDSGSVYVYQHQAMTIDLGALTVEQIDITGVKAELRQGTGVGAPVIQPFYSKHDGLAGSPGDSAGTQMTWTSPYSGGVLLRLTDKADGAADRTPVWPDVRPCYIASDGSLRTYPWLHYRTTTIADGRPFTYNKEWLSGSPTRGDGWTGALNASAPSASYDVTNLDVWASFPLVAAHSANDWKQFQYMNRADTISNIGYVGFIHTGVPWCTVGFTNNSTFSGVSDMVCFDNLLEFLVAPESPYEDGFDNDGDGLTDSADQPTNLADLAGPEIRQRGKINVNNAHPNVLAGLFSDRMLGQYKTLSGSTDTVTQLRTNVVNAILDERSRYPYTSVGNFIRRAYNSAANNNNLLHPDLLTEQSGGAGTAHLRNTFAAEGLVRSISNLVTVRTDQYIVLGRAQIYRGATVTTPDEVYSDRVFAAVVDRTYDPVRILYFRWLTE